MRTVTRRELLAAGAAAFLPAPMAFQESATGNGAAERALAALEAKAGGRLGVCLLEATSGRVAGLRLDERFGMCSTFKLPLAAVVLREAEAGRLRLDERLSYTKADLLANSPVTGRHVDEGAMTVVALAEAAQTASDNLAANLLLKRLGGPAALTARLRGLGDAVTRLDRFEMALNLVKPGDERDTTSPRAMARTIARCLVGDGLSAASRERLAGWMVATATGLARLRAGLPKDWRAGDKTGTAQADGMVDKTSDNAVVWPPTGSPVVISAYYDGPRATNATQDADQAVLAEVGRIAAAWTLAR